MINYSQIVADAGTGAVREIAESITASVPVVVLKPPAPGMVMVRHVDPLENTLFLLGEAYVTECEVEVAGSRGYGCVMGPDEQRALCAALVDAVLASGHELRARIVALLEEEQKRIETRREQESRAVASTRVSFDVR